MSLPIIFQLVFLITLLLIHMKPNWLSALYVDEEGGKLKKPYVSIILIILLILLTLKTQLFWRF